MKEKNISQLAIISRNKADYLTILHENNLNQNTILIIPKQIAFNYKYTNGIQGVVYFTFGFDSENNFSKNIEPDIKIIPKETLERNYIKTIKTTYSNLSETIVCKKECSYSKLKPCPIEEKYIIQAEKFVKKIFDFINQYNSSENKTDAINTPEFRNNYHFWD